VSLAEPAISQDGQVWTAAPLGAEVRAILAAGGLIERTRARISEAALSR
jgi:3-isopropylmalate/(R)-2-methylmalate dehydratase small subunit